MPRIKSAEKRVQIEKVRRAKNASDKSALRTAVKTFEKDEKHTATDLSVVSSILDKAAAKGTIHPNKAARKKSRLAKRLNNEAQA